MGTKEFIGTCNVADPLCLSRILDPDFYQSQILDPKTAQKLVVILGTFFVATNFTKLKIILFMKCRRKKIGPILKNYRNFYLRNFVTKLLKILLRGSGSEIRDPE
jgi:hypothetical protein